MKKILRFLALIPLLWTAHAAAAPCAPSFLAVYIGLGSTGCSIGANATFYDFALLEQPTGSTPFDSISVAPDGGNVGLSFAVNQNGDANTLYENLIAYKVKVTGLSVTGASAALFSSLVSGGQNTAAITYCLDGTFQVPDGLTNCIGGTRGALNLFDDGDPADATYSDALATSDPAAALAFPVTLLAVVTDIADDHNATELGFLGGVTNDFTLAAVTPPPSTTVPEPDALVLLGAGLVAAALVRRRA